MTPNIISTGTKAWFTTAFLCGVVSVFGSRGVAAQSKEATGVLKSSTNQALVLDGETAFVQVPDSAPLHTLSNAITLEACCLARSFSPERGSVNSILRKNTEAGAENFFLRIRNTDGPRLIELGLGSQLGVVQAPFELRTNQWYHLAATYDGSAVVIYVNGVEVLSQPRSGALAIDSSALVIGKGDPNFSSGEYFRGMLDEIRIWNIARSRSEIQAAMNRSLTGREPGLVAYWNFDKSAADDASGYRIHGQLEGKARITDAVRPLLTPIRFQNKNVSNSNVEELSAQKRIEVLEALWQNLSETYPALEYKGIRGREWLEPALRRIREVKSDQEFYEILLEQMATLKDTHTRILSYPGQPRAESPPVVLDQVEGQVAVLRADPATTLSAGEVILSIEGRPVAECVTAQMKRVCNSTERGRIREACERLLRGLPGTDVTVGVQDTNGVIRQATLRRESRPEFWREPAISAHALGESIGYIRISRWTDDTIPEQFDQALERFKSAPGIVIDVRGNGGGNDHLADLVNGRLITKPVVSSIDFWRSAGTDQYTRTIGWVEPRGPWTYQGRVAVLIDEGSTSACEHFVSGIEAMGRVLLVGEPTNGAGGGPTVVKLPDGTRMAISRALGLRANGVVFEGHGIPPDIYSVPTLKDLRNGRDAALEIAQDWLRSGKTLPPRTQPLSRP